MDFAIIDYGLILAHQYLYKRTKTPMNSTGDIKCDICPEID